MTDARTRAAFAAVFCLLVVATTESTQAQTVDVGGRAFLDYFYTLSSPVNDDEGLHGFTYRRLYLTADFQLSDDFEGRARLEANDGTAGSKGPVPFVKDLFLTWTYTAEHSVTVGVTPPPAFQNSEAVWGYRSLEKTILDFQGVVASRDFGIRFNGPVTPDGTIRYAAMLANNSATQPESDPYKRAYAQIGVHPNDRLAFVVGADHAGFDDPLESSTRLSGFGGYASDAFRIGVEGYWSNLVYANSDELAGIGLSAFGAVRVAPNWEVLGRVDRSKDDLPGTDRFETLFISGVSYAPNEFVRLIPNIWYYLVDEADAAEVLGRFTIDVRF